MKIVTKDNFDRDVFTEKVVAENVNEYLGKELVQAWKNEHWHGQSQYYLELVEDDYVLYDGYKEMIEMEKLATASTYQIDERPRYDVLEVKEVVIHTGDVAVIHYTNGTCQYTRKINYSHSDLVVEGDDSNG